MSTRILNVGVGQPYKHHFTDDLESFFWLILWCVVEHVDDRGTQPTEVARKLLRSLDRQNLDDIGNGKVTVFHQCLYRGARIKSTLNSCGNRWARDPAIAHVVVKLGVYFGDIHGSGSYLQCIPSEVFPKVVEIIAEALLL